MKEDNKDQADPDVNQTENEQDTKLNNESKIDDKVNDKDKPNELQNDKEKELDNKSEVNNEVIKDDNSIKKNIEKEPAAIALLNNQEGQVGPKSINLPQEFHDDQKSLNGLNLSQKSSPKGNKSPAFAKDPTVVEKAESASIPAETSNRDKLVELSPKEESKAELIDNLNEQPDSNADQDKKESNQPLENNSSQPKEIQGDEASNQQEEKPSDK